MRLGRNGVKEIQSHPFFQNDQWTFDTIRDCKQYEKFLLYFKFLMIVVHSRYKIETNYVFYVRNFQFLFSCESKGVEYRSLVIIDYKL